MTVEISEDILETIQSIRDAHDFEQIAENIVRLFWDLYEVRPDVEELETWITSHGKNIVTHGQDNDQLAISSNLVAFLRFVARAYGSTQDIFDKIETISLAFDAAASGLDLNAFANQLENWLNLFFECVGSHVRLPVTIEDDRIRIGRHCRIAFKRTLKIPEDGNDYPLPADFGRLPICRVEDYADKVPSKWLSEGGFFIPLYQKEALFLEFEGQQWRPCVAKVAIGRVNAVTGEEYDEKIRPHKQDYLVIPDQKWLDGINSGEGRVGQFVAMPLGQGFTVEAQVTDEETHGGFQVTVFDPKMRRFPEEEPEQEAQRQRNLDRRLHDLLSAKSPLDSTTIPPAAAKRTMLPSQAADSEQLQARSAGATEDESGISASDQLMARSNTTPAEDGDGIDALLAALDSEIPDYQAMAVAEMGIAKGGNIRQEIVEDTYGADSWDENKCGSIVIHLVNSEVFKLITGRDAPSTPITAEKYAEYKIPWFDDYDEAAPALLPAKALQHVKSIAAIEAIRGVACPDSNMPVKISSDRLRKIITPGLEERISDFVLRAKKSIEAGRYKIAARESSNAIELLRKNTTESKAPESNDPLFLQIALTIRAEANLVLGRFPDAEGDASDCLQMNETDFSALSIRAQALIGMGEHKLAITDANSLLRSESSQAVGFRVLAEGHLGSGAYDLAVENASAGLKFHAKDAAAYRVRAEAHLRMGKHTEAMQDATAALIYGDSNIRALLARAEAFLALGNSYDARQDVEEVLRMDTGNNEARKLSGKLPKAKKGKVR